jgi:choline dehydrogenase-like flavoprotein
MIELIKMRWISLNEAQNQNWDVVIIGSGIGGSTTALALAQAGKRVLLITKNDHVRWKSPVFDDLTKKEVVPFLGDGLGGSSSLYGMVMERLHATDFSTNGGQWPGSIHDWQNFYVQAERIFSVNPAFKQEALSPLFQHLQKQKLEIKSLPLACRQVPDCGYCQGIECRSDCKVSAVAGPLKQAAQFSQIYFLSGEAIDLKLRATSSAEVDLLVDGERGLVRSTQVVLAAGALRTPGLLRRCSKLPAIGRYLMRHLIDIYELHWPELNQLSNEERQNLARAKAWGTDSFYDIGGIKLGTLQSFGRLPDVADVWNELVGLHPFLRAVPFAQLMIKKWMHNISVDPLIASIVEDEASESNQVVERGGGRLEIHYRISKNDQEKIIQMRNLLKATLGSFMKRRLSEAENNFRLAHACGTCRMGSDTQTSVCNETGKVHFTENIWIADASVFPSSGGKNPALTIAAHALRLTEQLLH